MNAKKEQLIRKFFGRIREISNNSLALTAGLAKANIETIMYCGNAMVPKKVKLPEEEINKIKDLIINGPKDIIGSN